MESSHSQPSENEQSANPPAASQQPAAHKKTTILDLARFRLGQRAYWIVFRSERDPDFQRPAEW